MTGREHRGPATEYRKSTRPKGFLTLGEREEHAYGTHHRERAGISVCDGYVSRQRCRPRNDLVLKHGEVAPAWVVPQLVRDHDREKADGRRRLRRHEDYERVRGLGREVQPRQCVRQLGGPRLQYEVEQRRGKGSGVVRGGCAQLGADDLARKVQPVFKLNLAFAQADGLE